MRRRALAPTAASLALVACASPLLAGASGPGASPDWPQWLGPERTGVSRETGWLKVWPAAGPPVAWQASVGWGYASVAVAGGRAYTLGNDDRNDTVYCFDAANGSQIWTHSYPCTKGGYPGPRATPTVDGSRVYTLSREGHVFCFDAAAGTVIWGTDVRESAGAEVPRWGFAGSPLVEGDLLILNVGTRGAALDKGTGKVVWRTGTDASGYASPLGFTANGKRWVAIFAAEEIAVLAVATGEKMWSRPWRTRYDVNAATPIVSDGRIFVSSDYGTGCALIEIGGGVIWQNTLMRNHFNNCVLWEGALYGFDMSTLKCLDFRTGREQWAEDGLGKGSLVVADGSLLVMSEKGELLVAEATPARFAPTARAKVLGGLCWTIPVLSGGRIYCRNKEGDLKCLDVRPEE